MSNTTEPKRRYFKNPLTGLLVERRKRHSVLPYQKRDPAEVDYLRSDKSASGFKFIHKQGRTQYYQVYVWVKGVWTYVGAWLSPLEAAFNLHDFIKENEVDRFLKGENKSSNVKVPKTYMDLLISESPISVSEEVIEKAKLKSPFQSLAPLHTSDAKWAPHRKKSPVLKGTNEHKPDKVTQGSV